mmetsp:Transcript_13462/g.17009  ORF Transcript_13462/g.17009 Transcript_13462/m.17009 type:complete len:248 (-) Transcript_13462:258-1001(-)
MRLLNHLLTLCGTQKLFIKSKSIKRLVIWSLVPPEPLPNTILYGLGHIIDIIVLLGERIIDRDGKDLPIELTIVNHGEYTKWLDLGDTSHVERLGANFDNINRIIVTKDLELRVFLIRILPCLWQTSVVPEDWSVVITEIALLYVLCNRVGFFLGGDFHLGLGHFRNFDYHVVPLVALERDVVPWGDGGSISVFEAEAEGFGSGLTGDFGGDGEECGSEGGAWSGTGEYVGVGPGVGGAGGDGEECK